MCVLHRVTSVQFNPSNSWEILTAGRDSTARLLDARTLKELHLFHHTDFKIDLSYATCSISPDGKYVSAGSCKTGDLFVWSTADGNLVNQLKGHGSGVVAVAWNRGGTNGQQVSSVDKDGNLLLWA